MFPIAAFLSEPLRAGHVVAYHRAIADAAGMPLVLFQLQPILGGVLYPPEVLRRAAGDPRGGRDQGGVASTRCAGSRSRRTSSRQRRITLLTGNDNFIAESFLLGAQGALLGFATLLTPQQVELQAALRR